MDFSIPNPEFFKVELLPSGIIYATRRGNRTDEGIELAIARGSEMAAYLRQQSKPVLILNNARFSNAGPRVMELLIQLDFDRWAVYGASARQTKIIELRVRANGLDQKIALFQTRGQALSWLRYY